jgi:DNA-binding transcriptional regulator YiaG
MGKMEQTLREEITRLSRKEIRAAIDPLRREVRELKRTVRALSRTVEGLEKALKAARKAQGPPTPSSLAADPAEVSRARLSPGLIKKLRRKLGVTQQEFAALLDASPSTVAFWEQGRTRPKPETKARIVALRKLGRRDVKQLLAQREAGAE